MSTTYGRIPLPQQTTCLTSSAGHLVHPQSSWWQQHNPEALWQRCNRRIRPHSPTRHARRQPTEGSTPRPHRPHHSPRTRSECLLRERRRTLPRSRTSPPRSAQPRRDRSRRHKEDFTQRMGLLLQRKRRLTLQSPEQQRLPLHPPPSTRLRRLHAMRPHHRLPRLQAGASRIRQPRGHGSIGKPRWRVGNRPSVQEIRCDADDQ